MKNMPVGTLKPGTQVTGDVFLDEGFILATPDVPISSELIKRLITWGFREVFVEEGAGVKPSGLENIGEGDVTSAFLETAVKEGSSWQDTQRFYVAMLEFTHKVFDLFLKKGQIPVDPITEQMKGLISHFKSNRRYILRLGDLDRNGFSYLTCHCVNAAILGVAMGESLKLPPHKVIELGMAGLLHEIGMFKLPDSFQNASRNLNQDEKKALTAHPLLGYRSLKEAGFPPNVTLAVLEHHEKIDGSGYPQKLTGDKIPVAAKILAITSAYDALITPRPFRDAFTGHATLVEMLKEMGKSWDDQVLRRLVFTIGLYPIGTYLEMKGGALALVYDANPENPKVPEIQILTDEKKSPLTDRPVIKLSERPEFVINKVLSTAEVRQFKSDKIIPA